MEIDTAGCRAYDRNFIVGGVAAKMAIYTVRGNKTTKELKKGVSIMKKSCFKVLCMVLIIALLAPNAFAATPAPEVPCGQF